jgi:hypothetical protein
MESEELDAIKYMAALIDLRGVFYIQKRGQTKGSSVDRYVCWISLTATQEEFRKLVYDTFSGFGIPLLQSRCGGGSIQLQLKNSYSLDPLCSLCLPYLKLQKRKCELILEMRRATLEGRNIDGVARREFNTKKALIFTEFQSTRKTCVRTKTVKQ